MSPRFPAALIALLLAGSLAAGQVPENAPRLENQTEEEYDRIVDRFILYDIGRLGVLEGQQALRDFNRLDARAIPALVRGLNRAANIEASCPVVLISNKLRSLLSFTEDTRVLESALRTLGQGVNRTYHAEILRDVRQELVHRRTAIEQGKLEALRARDRLVRQVMAQKPDQVRQALQHQEKDMRWAAARAAGARGLPFGEELLVLLRDSDSEVREAARQALVRLSRGLNYGPASTATEAEQEEAIQQWRTWWAAAEAGFALVSAPPEQQAALLARLRDGKGVHYTQALAEAIPQLPASARLAAQDALAERLARMTTATLRDKLQDDNREIRRAAALACALRDDRSAVPDLIGKLEDADPVVARSALVALKQLTGKDLGPPANGTAAVRAAAVRRWRDWWAKQGNP